MREDDKYVYIEASDYLELSPDQKRRVDQLVTHGDTIEDAIREVTAPTYD